MELFTENNKQYTETVYCDEMVVTHVDTKICTCITFYM